MEITLPYREKDLDKILDDGFKYSKEFSRWFLSKTRFSKLNAVYKWSRSDNPWGSPKLRLTLARFKKTRVGIRQRI